MQSHVRRLSFTKGFRFPVHAEIACYSSNILQCPCPCYCSLDLGRALANFFHPHDCMVWAGHVSSHPGQQSAKPAIIFRCFQHRSVGRSCSAGQLTGRQVAKGILRQVTERGSAGWLVTEERLDQQHQPIVVEAIVVGEPVMVVQNNVVYIKRHFLLLSEWHVAGPEEVQGHPEAPHVCRKAVAW